MQRPLFKKLVEKNLCIQIGALLRETDHCTFFIDPDNPD